MNLFFIDTETTGLDCKKHEIIELAFAIVIDGVTHCKMELFMRPEKWDTISQEALNVNGWSIEKLKRLSISDVFRDGFFNIIGRCRNNNKLKIVEYGNRFDFNFLKNLNWFNSPVGMFDFIFQKQSINVLSLAKKKLPGLKSYRLRDVAKHLRIPVHDGKLHGGGYDRDLFIEVYKKLGGGF